MKEKHINKSSRILLTGGTGFLGSYILRCLLHAGYSQISAICRSSSSFDLVEDIRDKIQWTLTDLNDYDKLEELTENADIVIHSAALISFSKKDYKKMNLVNIEGTRQLVDLALDNEIQQFIYISSVEALGIGLENEIISEQTEWKTSKIDSHYGITKQYAEREVWRGFVEGLNTTIINPSFIIGASRWDEGPMSFVRKIDQGLSFYPNGCNGVVDVRDVAQMVLEVMVKMPNGKRIICSAENMTHKELFEKVAQELGVKAPASKLSMAIGTIAIYTEKIKSWLTGKTALITKESLRIASHSFEYDNEYSRNLLNFKYRSITNCIRDTITAYNKSDSKGNNYAVFPWE